MFFLCYYFFTVCHIDMNGYNAVYVYSIWFHWFVMWYMLFACCTRKAPSGNFERSHTNYPFISLCCWCVVCEDAFGFLFLISHMWQNWGPLPKDLADLWHVIWKLYFVAEVAVYWIVYSNKFCADFFSWLTIDTNKIAIQLASFYYNFRENLIRTKVKRIARTYLTLFLKFNHWVLSTKKKLIIGWTYVSRHWDEFYQIETGIEVIWWKSRELYQFEMCFVLVLFNDFSKIEDMRLILAKLHFWSHRFLKQLILAPLFSK